MNFIRLARIRTVQRSFWNHVLAALLLVAVLSSCGGSAKKNQILERADRFFKTGEYEKAKLEYLRLLRIDRSNSIASRQLGFIWLEEGAPLEAYPYLCKAHELDPDNLEVRAKLAKVLSGVGAFSAARKEAAAVLERSSNQPDAILVLIDTARTEEEFEEAQDKLREIPEGNEASYHFASANLAISQGDLAYARAELEAALKLQPASSKLHLSLAGLYRLNQERQSAAAEFETAARLAPIRSEARLQQAEFQRELGHTREAISILNETTQKAPDYFPAWCALAEIALAEKDFDRALRLLENVLSRDPQNLDGLVLQGEAWLGQGEPKKAVYLLENMAAAYPNVPLINYHLARAYAADNYPVKAVGALNDALSVNPDYVDAILLSAELNVRNSGPALAVPALEKLLRKKPGLTAAQSLLVEAYRVSGRLDDAVELVREKIEESPRLTEWYVRLGIILRQQHKIDEARRTFEEALELEPANFSALEELVDIDIDQKNFAGGLAMIQQKLEKTPKSAELLFLIGKIYCARKDWPQAQTALRHARDVAPDFLPPFELLIASYVSNNQLPQAIDELQTFLAKNPQNKNALTSLALVYHKKGEFTKARDAYEKVLFLSPDSPGTLNNLAYIYSEYLNQPDKALELANRARNLQPLDPWIADTLGWTLYKKGDYGGAMTVLGQSLQKLQQNNEVEYHFGMSSYMMGELDRARDALQRAVHDANGAPNPEAKRRLSFLENESKQPLSTSQLESIVQGHSDDVAAWLVLGEACEKQAEFPKAAGPYGRAFDINPKLVRAAVKLAELYSGPLKNQNMAYSFAKRARELAPNDGNVARILGQIVYQLGNFWWANSLLQESVRKLPNDAHALHDLAWSAYSISNVPDARRSMERVLQVDPDPVLAEDARSFLAMTALVEDQANLAGAESHIRKILAVDPAYVPALMARAKLLTQRGDAKSAEAIYMEVLHRYPEFGVAQKNLAALCLDEPARTDEGFGIALRARSTLPNDPELAGILGELSYKKNEYEYAIQCFQESAHAHPLHSRALYYLGMSQFRMSQDDQSRLTLQKALAAGLEGPLSKEAKATIADLTRRVGL